MWSVFHQRWNNAYTCNTRGAGNCAHNHWVTLTVPFLSLCLFSDLKHESSDPEISPIYAESILLSAAKKKRKKKRLGHSAHNPEMLALSLAHGSVNSLQGPLAQRGVQGCREINQQLVSSHCLGSCFNSLDLVQSEILCDNPEQNLVEPSNRSHSAENVEIKKMGVTHSGYTRHR